MDITYIFVRRLLGIFKIMWTNPKLMSECLTGSESLSFYSMSWACICNIQDTLLESFIKSYLHITSKEYIRRQSLDFPTRFDRVLFTLPQLPDGVYWKHQLYAFIVRIAENLRQLCRTGLPLLSPPNSAVREHGIVCYVRLSNDHVRIIDSCDKVNLITLENIH